jgi:crotonobetainyl-CoA:carnitine CoA-transferase CaiB-like acyl-CoA transferase
MISLSGYGLTGPYRDRVAFGTPLTMISGLGALSGYRGRGPSEVGISYGDPNGGLHGAFALLAALWQRESTGRGQYIDVSQWESLVAILPEGVLPYTMSGQQPERIGNRDPIMAPHGIFRAKGEDRWVSIACRSDDDWQRLAEIVQSGLASNARFLTAADRKRNEDELESLITAWTERLDEWEIAERLQRAAIPAAPAMDMADVAEDPHMNGRGFFVELEHPEVGRQKHAGIPWQLSGTPLHVRKPAPCLGEDNEYIVKELLGHNDEEFERLVAEGVLY